MAHETRVHVDETVPAVRIEREFDAPVRDVYRAHVDPDLFARWIGPRSLTTTVEHWDARSGGSWRFVQRRGDDVFAFWGCFHEIRENERVIMTQTYGGAPDGVLLSRMVLTPLDGDRTRLVATATFESFAARDAMVTSGMEYGVREGYEKLDELVAAPSR